MNTHIFFEVAARYDKLDDKGVVRLFTEQFIVQAASFTQAEALATRALMPLASGAFRVVKEKISNISEVITAADTPAHKFYKVKHSVVTVDEKTGQERMCPQYLLFQATSNDDARTRYDAYMQDSFADTELEAISETKFVDYITEHNTSKNEK